MVASLWHQLLGTKVRLLVGLLAGVLRGGSSGLAEGGVQTTTCSGCKPIVVRVHITTRSGCKPLLVCSSNHYWFAS